MLSEKLKAKLSANFKARSVKHNFESLLYYIHRGNDKKFNELIKKVDNLDKQDVYGYTALMVAIKNNKNGYIQEILDRTTEFEQVNSSGNNVFMVSAIFNNLQCLELLMDKTDDIHKFNRDNETALSIFVCRKNIAGIKLILDNTDGFNKAIGHALLTSVRSRDTEITNILLNRFDDSEMANNYLKLALNPARRRKLVDIISAIKLKQGDYETTLIDLTKQGDYKAAKELMLDPSTFEDRLKTAAANKDASSIEHILSIADSSFLTSPATPESKPEPAKKPVISAPKVK